MVRLLALSLGLALALLPSRAHADLDAGLVARYALDGNAHDASGHGHHGVLVGRVTPAPDRFGVAGGAIALDGQGGYVRAPADGLPTAERTIAFWFQADEVSDHPCLLSYGGRGCGTSWLMGINAAGLDYPDALYISSHCNFNKLVIGYGTPPVGSWRHWAVTTAPDGTRMYLDGAEVGSSAAFVENTAVRGAELALGACTDPEDGLAPYSDSTVSFFRGRLDEVRIYDRALGPDEIRRLASAAPPAPALIPLAAVAASLALASLGALSLARRAG
jgi:hypothetical protein